MAVKPPPLTEAQKRAKLLSVLRQLSAQYRTYTKGGGTQDFNLWLADSVQKYIKAHPEVTEEPGLESEGIGPIGWIISLFSEGPIGLTTEMGATGVEELAKQLWDLFTTHGVLIEPTNGDPTDGGVPPMGVPDDTGGGGGGGGDGGGCFAAGTLVGIDNDHSLPIESLVAGDVVSARDEATRVLGAHAIERIWEHDARPIIELELSTGEKIRTTAKHRMFEAARGFVGVQDLAAGDRLLTRSGDAIAITRIGPTGERTTVYNLTVRTAHTYFVGRAQVWVHNTKVDDPSESDDDESDDDELSTELKAKK